MKKILSLFFVALASIARADYNPSAVLSAAPLTSTQVQIASGAQTVGGNSGFTSDTSGNVSVNTLLLPKSTASTAGVLKINGAVVFSTYDHGGNATNLFLGGAGNFTLSSSGQDNVGVGPADLGSGNFDNAAPLVAITSGHGNTVVGAASGSLLAIDSYNEILGPNNMNSASLNGANFNWMVASNCFQDITTGYQNIAISDSSYGDLTTGNNNAVEGDSGLGSLTTGNNNWALGEDVGNNIVTGSDNLMWGGTLTPGSGGQPGTGNGFTLGSSGNIAIGVQAGMNSGAQTRNVYIGHLSGGGATTYTGTGSIFLGPYSGYNNVTTSAFAIENQQEASAANEALYSPIIGTLHTAAGTTSGTALTLNGTWTTNGLDTGQISDSATNTQPAAFEAYHKTSGTAGTSFGVAYQSFADDATVAQQEMASNNYQWTNATHASRSAEWILQLAKTGVMTTILTATSTGAVTIGGTASTLTLTGLNAGAGGVSATGNITATASTISAVGSGGLLITGDGSNLGGVQLTDGTADANYLQLQSVASMAGDYTLSFNCNNSYTLTMAGNATLPASPPSNSLQTIAAGTAYTLTASNAALVFGTTSPTVTLPAAGTYSVSAVVQTNLVGATYAGPQTVTYNLARTNNTPAALAGTTFGQDLTIAAITTITTLGPTITIPPILYTTSNTTDIITINGILSATPSVGSVTCTNATITAIWVHP